MCLICCHLVTLSTVQKLQGIGRMQSQTETGQPSRNMNEVLQMSEPFHCLVAEWFEDIRAYRCE